MSGGLLGGGTDGVNCNMLFGHFAYGFPRFAVEGVEQRGQRAFIWVPLCEKRVYGNRAKHGFSRMTPIYTGSAGPFTSEIANRKPWGHATKDAALTEAGPYLIRRIYPSNHIIGAGVGVTGCIEARLKAMVARHG